MRKCSGGSSKIGIFSVEILVCFQDEAYVVVFFGLGSHTFGNKPVHTMLIRSIQLLEVLALIDIGLYVG